MNENLSDTIQWLLENQRHFMKNVLYSFSFSALLIALYLASPFLLSWNLGALFFAAVPVVFLAAHYFLNSLLLKAVYLPMLKPLPGFPEGLAAPLAGERFRSLGRYLLLSDPGLALYDLLPDRGGKNRRWRYLLLKTLFLALLFLPFLLLTLLTATTRNQTLFHYMMVLAALFVNFLYNGFFKFLLLLYLFGKRRD